MKFLNDIKNKTILLIPYDIKEKVLEYLETNNLFLDIKIITFDEYKKRILFDYDKETIYYVLNKFNIKYEIALDYIKNLYYIENIKYEDEKLKFLSYLKNDLDDKNLLIYDKLFINLLKSYDDLIVFGFDYLSSYDNYLIDKASSYINVKKIPKTYNDYKHKVYEFNHITEEITFVAESIKKLISEGVSLNKIYLSNYDADYDFTIKYIFSLYDIPCYLNNMTSLYKTRVGKYFIDNLESDINKTLEKVKNKFNLKNENNKDVYDKIITVLNEYFFIEDKLLVKDLIKEDLKKKKITFNHYKYEIKNINLLNNIISDDEYVFLIGFNNNYPKLKKDEDYISDNIKPCYMDSANTYNKNIKNVTFNVIKNIKNIFISYKLNSSFSSFNPSILIDNDYLVKDKTSLDYSNYSDKINKINLGRSIDRLIKYNEKSDNLDILYSNYPTTYMSYNHKFKGIDNDLLLENINDKLNFSYSNISSYYECPFKFYVSNILHINEFETKLHTYIGSLFHYVLEKCLDNDLDIEETYFEYINNNEFPWTNKDKFFVEILKEELYFVIDTIKKQYKHSSHKETLKEQRIEIEIEKPIKTKVKGFIDKLLICDDNVVIIDYKTGNTFVDKRYFEYGLYLQLPIYIYLVKNFNKDYNIVGIYLQHILNSKLTFKPSADMDLLKENNLMLDGLTLSDEKYIKLFDDSYEKSTVIKKLRLKKDGDFYNKSIMISKDEIDKLYDLVSNLIESCIKNVSEGKFDIYPVKVGKDIDGCKFCNYRDICYRDMSDFNYKEELGGENNGTY